MARFIYCLLVCLLLVSLVGCMDDTTQPPTPTPAAPDVDDQGNDAGGAASLQGAASTSNTSLKLFFDHPLGESATDLSLYQIYRPPLCAESAWQAQLAVSAAELSADGKVVTLTTAPQAGISYQLSLSGLQDAHGAAVEADTPLIFNGTAAGEAVQSDGDGVSDADEQLGWAVVTTSAEGTQLCRDVNSDPSVDDTDADQVPDNIEMGYGSDPRSPDSDGDELGDFAEINEYASNPLLADTDADGIADGIEAHLLGTSPALKDTDGDGIDDAAEIATGGTDPRLADLPELALDLHGNPSLILNMSVTQNVKTTKVETTLEQDRTEKVDTDNSSTKMSIENTVSLHTEAEVGTSQWPPSASAKLTTDTEFKHGYFHETSSNWTGTSVKDSQDKFEKAMEEFNVTSYDDGMLWVAMKVSNHSDLTFKLKDLRVIAYRMLPNGSFNTVGTLVPGIKSTSESKKDIWLPQALCADPADAATCGHILAPGGEIVLMVGADSLPAQEMKALVADPSAMMFEIGSYSLFQLDEWGVTETVNYAKLGESVTQRTGILVVDFGDGTVERYSIAANVMRNPDGSGKGLLLADAMRDVAGISDFELCPDGKTLCRIKQAATFRCDQEMPPQISPEICPPGSLPAAAGAAPTPQATPTPEPGATAVISPTLEIAATQPMTPTIPLGFWIVAGSGTEFDGNPSVDFNNLRLTSGERISLVYMLDSDGDGIYDREEYLLGTDKHNVDSDGDGLDDYQETKEGWQVSIVGKAAYPVYPDPRFADFDRDFLSDKTELYLKTDPYLRDTDGDGLTDNLDPYPTALPCVPPEPLSLTAWWDGTNLNSVAGVNLPGSSRTPPTIKDENWRLYTLGVSNPAEKEYSFNLDINKPGQYISVADTTATHNSLQSNREFTLSAWLSWNGNVTDTVPDAILWKGPATNPTYALAIAPDGKLQFSIYRSVHKKVWYYWFGSAEDDNAAADSDYTERNVLSGKTVLPKNQWVHVTATFGGETMRLYLNGQKDAELFTTYTWWDGCCYKNMTYTNNLISNSDPLLIGIEKADAPTWFYRGLMDDVQFYTRALQAEEIAQVYRFGTCKP